MSGINSLSNLLDIDNPSTDSIQPPNVCEGIFHNNLENENDFKSDFHSDNEPEDAEELFGDEFENDYRQIPHLDIYGDTSMIDDESTLNMLTTEQKISAEAEMIQRERTYPNSFCAIKNRKGLLYDPDDETNLSFKGVLNSDTANLNIGYNILD